MRKMKKNSNYKNVYQKRKNKFFQTLKLSFARDLLNLNKCEKYKKKQ